MEWIRTHRDTAGCLIACLCAGWCTTCTAYRPVFAALAQQHLHDTLVWVDIEDDAEWLGDIEVENFPTLLIASSGQVRFFGTVTPHAQTLERLVAAARTGGAAAGSATAEVEALAARLAEVTHRD